MPRQSDARQRMVESAAVLFRERGIEGTSFSDVLAHSGAPRGSIYHHFPDGKTQLAEAATRYAGEYILASTAAALADDDPIAALDASRQWWTGILRDSGYQAGCVIAAAAQEGDREPTVRAAAAEAFSTWEKGLADALRRRGVPAARARSVATLIVAGVEGAVVLSRAKQSTTPLQRVVRELKDVITDAIDHDAN